MRKAIVFTVSALAFMLLLLLSTSHALADCSHLCVRGTYHLSQNFQGRTLTIEQSDTTIWGTVEDDAPTSTSISGSLNCSVDPATITFTRSGVGFTQQFTGSIFAGKAGTACDFATLLYGTFNHNGTGRYGWYAAR
jgi:hypothetical protein